MNEKEKKWLIQIFLILSLLQIPLIWLPFLTQIFTLIICFSMIIYIKKDLYKKLLK
jgi:hypothetical protein